MDGAPVILNRNLITSLILITAVVLGFGAGILWTSQGKFISDCACEENQGFFHSYFWGFMQMSSIIGNIIAGIMLKTEAD